MTDDLGLESDLVGHDARLLKDAHPAIAKFVALRGVAPRDGEPTFGPYPRGLVRSLHVGAARGVTTWDEVEEVCWLLAFGSFHRNGDPNDAYKIFNLLHTNDTLLPTAADYEALFLDRDDRLVDRLRIAGARLLAEARRSPGTEAVETWHDRGRQVICVDLVVEDDGEAEDGWMGLTLPSDERLSDSEVYDLVAALLPDAAHPIWSATFRGRPRRTGEIVFRWERYETHP